MTKPFVQLADDLARHWASAAAEHDRAGRFPATDMALSDVAANVLGAAALRDDPGTALGAHPW